MIKVGESITVVLSMDQLLTTIFIYKFEGLVFMKLHLKENFEELDVYSFMHNIYTQYYVTCACCGHKISNDNTTVFFNNTSRPDAYTYSPNDGNGVYYDPHNLPAEDEVGATFVPVIAETEDYEGYHWKDYCKPCWEKLKYKSDEEIYATTGTSDYD